MTVEVGTLFAMATGGLFQEAIESDWVYPGFDEWALLTEGKEVSLQERDGTPHDIEFGERVVNFE